MIWVSCLLYQNILNNVAHAESGSMPKFISENLAKFLQLAEHLFCIRGFFYMTYFFFAKEANPFLPGLTSLRSFVRFNALIGQNSLNG